jgi:molybdate-binding protein
VAKGNPKGITGLAGLAQPGVRFVNRQLGSGTRVVPDLLLAGEGIASAAIAGDESAEFTHAAVAALVASGMADAGFGVETAARASISISSRSSASSIFWPAMPMRWPRRRSRPSRR